MSTAVRATGTFCWPELTTSDQAGAKTFYCALFGWIATDSPAGEGGVYTTFELDGKPVGAACAMDAEQKARSKPHWLSYVAVANVDEMLTTATSLGGSVAAGPFDFMGAGRMGLLQDPSGATLALWQPKQHAQVLVIDQPGALVWTELVSANAEISREFCSKLFGWSLQLHEKGPTKHTVFVRGKAPADAKTKASPDLGKLAPSHWLPYFGASNVDDIAAKARKLGGRAIIPPTEVPGVGRFSLIQDPQGAPFGVIKFTGGK